MASPESSFEQKPLGSIPIQKLGLAIAGTRLEPLIREFEGELEKLGLKVRPRIYLSTEWGVPFGSTTIAMPFYLARPELTELQGERTGIVEGLNRRDILRYLRHEMGHVVNYAWHLYEEEEWVHHFGSITQPYLEEYRPEPFSRRYVRHLPGWYAQKHPDEDWSETFAVWMTPGPPWREEYRDWPTALRKLEYCDRTLARLRESEPVVTAVVLDEDVGELRDSLEEYYKRQQAGPSALPPGLDGALRAIFEDLGEVRDIPAKKAADSIRKHERQLINDVYRWTGHSPERTRALLRALADRAEQLEQVYPAALESQVIVGITTLVTALAMNHVHNGTYLP